MNKTPTIENQLIDALSILKQIVIELGITNVRRFGFYKNKWVVQYLKGKQNKFETFDEMYNFLKEENT